MNIVDQRPAVRAHGSGNRAPEMATPTRIAAAVIANRNHTSATVEPIAVVDFYADNKDRP